MPQQLLVETVDAVIGVDTHRDTHTACLVNPVGGELASLTVSADPTGYRHLLTWARQHAPGPRLVWAIEGSRSHGTGLLRCLQRAGEQVIEADRLRRPGRRPGGKSDPIDARRAARAALGRAHHARPRTDGPRKPASPPTDLSSERGLAGR